MSSDKVALPHAKAHFFYGKSPEESGFEKFASPSHYFVPQYIPREYTNTPTREKYLGEFIAERAPKNFDVVIGADSNGEVYGFMRPPINGERGVIYVDGTIGTGAISPGKSAGDFQKFVAGHELTHMKQLNGKLKNGYALDIIEREAEHGALDFMDIAQNYATA